MVCLPHIPFLDTGLWQVLKSENPIGEGTGDDEYSLFFAGCNLSFRNSPGAFFILFFITTVILHFTFQEIILLIYLFHCSGKSTQ